MHRIAYSGLSSGNSRYGSASLAPVFFLAGLRRPAGFPFECTTKDRARSGQWRSRRDTRKIYRSRYSATSRSCCTSGRHVHVCHDHGSFSAFSVCAPHFDISHTAAIGTASSFISEASMSCHQKPPPSPLPRRRTPSLARSSRRPLRSCARCRVSSACRSCSRRRPWVSSRRRRGGCSCLSSKTALIRCGGSVMRPKKPTQTHSRSDLPLGERCEVMTVPLRVAGGGGLHVTLTADRYEQF